MTDTFTVERSRVIAAPAAHIYPLIIDFHEWTRWSPWEDVDPGMSRTYSGEPSGVGAEYAWSGNRKAGEGTMRITEATENERVAIALQFVKPFRSSNTTTFRLAPGDDGSTRVTWTMVGPKTFMTKVMGIFKSMDAMIGPDFEKGLDALASAAGSPAD